jgi:hypothetical protein
MARQKLDKETRKALLNARKMIEEIAKADMNEAETRKRIDYIFGTIMGYDTFKHITQEYAVHGAGDTVHCDFAVQIDHEESSKPDFLVEIKRVNIDLTPKHLRQAASYAIDIGCEWVLLTNSKEWKLYHISFGKPPQTKLVDSWNLISDDLAILARKFNLIGYKNIKKGSLVQLWERANVLSAQNILKVILSERSMILIRRELKRVTDVMVSPEEIVGAVRHLLNEAALTEMEKIKISLPRKKQQKRKASSKSREE